MVSNLPQALPSTLELLTARELVLDLAALDKVLAVSISSMFQCLYAYFGLLVGTKAHEESDLVADTMFH